MSDSGVFIVSRGIEPDGDARLWPAPRRPVGVVFPSRHENMDACIDRFREQNPGVDISRLYVVSWSRRYGHKVVTAEEGETAGQAIDRYKTSQPYSQDNQFIAIRFVSPANDAPPSCA
jgi:hypothetical protein